MSQQNHAEKASMPPRPGAFDSTSKLAALIIGVAAVILGIVAGVFNPFLSGAVSTEGTRIDTLFSVTLGIATVVFVVVQGALIYSIVRFNRKPGDESDGLPIRGHMGVEILWTAIPAVVVVFLGIYSYQVLADIEQPQSGEMIVEVKAIQYAWEFYYPDHDVTSSELHIPLDRTVFLKMRSTDVIHSFWVPQFRVKKDVMPDRITEARITGTELGTYPIVCAELCGAGHAIMRSQVVVESDASFQAWIAGRGRATTRAADITDPIALGRERFNQYACNACHVLSDANAMGQIGPNLDGIGGWAGEMIPGQTAEEYLRNAIIKPNDFVPEGYAPNIMPQDYALRMPPEDVDALVQYMLSQK